MGIELEDKTNLLMPEVEINPTRLEERPDILLIRNQIRLLDSRKKLTASSRLPNIRVFGSAGLGNPGYNILDNTIQPMGLIGIGLRWNIWDWKSAGNERKKLTIQQQTLEYNLNRQQLQLNTQLAQQSEEISRLEEVMNDDEAIISLRKEVLDIKAAQLENGVITSSDFIVELNNSNMADLNKSIHNLEWIQAKINYNIIAGN
jgi:outer membrane protein TolC